MAATAIKPVSNDAARLIEGRRPYRVALDITGIADLLFHRWSNEAVQAKNEAPKNSKTKKTDDLESYVYRTADGHLALPGRYLQQALIQAARFHQDPRSPRKSLMDLAKAAFVVTPTLADLGVDTWDYIDRQRVLVQRNAITRARPALLAGWQAAFEITVVLAEYITAPLLYELAAEAGRLVGVGDYRPTYGRFAVTRFEVLDDAGG